MTTIRYTLNGSEEIYEIEITEEMAALIRGDISYFSIGETK